MYCENYVNVNFHDENFVIALGEPTPAMDHSKFSGAKIFGIGYLVTKLTKRLCHENLEPRTVLG